MERRQPQRGGAVRERHRSGPTRGKTPYLDRRQLGVPCRQDAERYQSVRRRGGPLVHLKVVPRADALEGEFLVLGSMKHAPAEARKGGKAQRCVNAIDVHILYPLTRVVAAGQHLFVTHGLHAIVVRILASDGVQPDLWKQCAFESPHMMSLVVLDDLWS